MKTTTKISFALLACLFLACEEIQTEPRPVESERIVAEVPLTDEKLDELSEGYDAPLYVILDVNVAVRYRLVDWQKRHNDT